MKKRRRKWKKKGSRGEKISEMTLGGDTGGPSSNVTMGPSRR
jgi:hypothetical protein